MIHITPHGSFPVVRQLEDVEDTTTYYVRAVVRDSETGDILKTIDLVDNGDQRFTKNYSVPADASGFGRYIDITTTVYSDSGYTTRAGFSDENETYLIKEDTKLGGGVGAGETVSYPEIRKIIKQELKKLEMPEPAKVEDLRPALKSMGDTLRNDIQKSVDSIKIPEQVKPNLDKVTNDIRTDLDTVINTLLLAIDNKEVTPETNLMPVIEMIQNLPIEEIVATHEQSQELLSTLQGMVEAQEEMNTLRTAAEQFTSAIGQKKLPEIKKEPEVNPFQQRARNLLGNPQQV